jgi:hypothetical protein
MSKCHENPASIMPGTYHRARNGTKVFIQAVLEPFDEENRDFPVFGAFYDNDGGIVYAEWSIEGRLDEYFEEDILDLVKEWKEPRKIIRWLVKGLTFETMYKTEQDAISFESSMKASGDIYSRIMLIGYEE